LSQRIILEQHTQDWHDFRSTHIGASDAPVIMGVSPWKTPEQLLHDKIKCDHNHVTAAHMQNGLDMEETVRKHFYNTFGMHIEPAIFVSDTHPWMMASLDGIDAEGRIVEIKCPGISDHKTALKGDIPKKYYPQLQHQMYVCEQSWIRYASYRDFDVKYILVHRDEIFIKKMIQMESDFYEKMIECSNKV
jgi:putative phage-type endonuclease